MHHNKCVIVFSSKHKQTKPGAHTEPAEIPAFTQNPKICLVSHLHAYLKQTEPLRKGQELLISFNKPHAPVARGTFSRWVKTMLAAAGVDTVHYGPHTTRAASCSAAANQGASLTSILKAAGWSSEATFTRFYKKTVVDNPAFGHSVLRSFVKKHGIWTVLIMFFDAYINNIYMCVCVCVCTWEEWVLPFCELGCGRIKLLLSSIISLFSS